MCGIGGILRVVRPGDPDYPADGSPLREAPGARLWHGLDVRDLDYQPVGSAHDPSPQSPSWFIPEPWLDAMDEKIAWRGPDGAGRFRDRVIKPDGTIVEVALVHRRLSIIDHETGAQPMVCDSCPRCNELAHATSKKEKAGASGSLAQASGLKSQASFLAVVFNGCIYNHRELRRELEAKGHEFFTNHSDTEVLSHGWRERHTDKSIQPDGMCAAAIWDPQEAELTLGVDRFGEKPLFVSWVTAPELYVVASTAEACKFAVSIAEPPAAGRHERRNIDKIQARTIVEWVSFGFAVQGGLFSPLYQVPPRHGLRAPPRAGHQRRRATSDLVTHVGETAFALVNNFSGGWAGRFRESVTIARRGSPLSIRALEDLLEHAVLSRLTADVPLACFLSGGMDSSLIAYYARRHDPHLATICVRMPSPQYDESAWADRVARHIESDHIVHECDGLSAADDLVEVLQLLTLPLGDSSILPAYWLCRAAAAHVKVALAGDGGDELFFGYDRYRAIRPFWHLAGLVPSRFLDQSDPKSNAARVARLATAARHGGYLDLLACFPQPLRRRLFGDSTGWISQNQASFASATWAREFDVRNYLPGDLLRKTDTASLAAGIEVRCPFLEPKLAEAALATPARVHMRGGQTKALLRELARKHLPPGIADRPKQGFAIPISDWFREDFGGLRTLLLDHLEGDRPFGKVHDVLQINMDFVRQMLDEHWAAGGLTPMHTTRAVRQRDHGQRLFALLSLAIWSKTLT